MTCLARCTFLLVVTTGLCFSFCGAQSKTTSSPAGAEQQALQASAPTLHTNAKLVVVDVIVRDKSGHPIHGLTQSDFLLSEGGKQQALNSFEEYAAASLPPSPPQMPALPPGLFTNYTPVPAKGPLNVLLIDGLNTPLSDQAYLRQQMLDYAQHFPPGTRIAIFGLADHLYMLQGFTSDQHQLLASLGGLKNRTSPLQANESTSNEAVIESLSDPGANLATTDPSSALMSSSLQTFVEQLGVSQKTMQIHETIEAFNLLARWLVNFPGRKNLVWFSGAFPLGVDPTVSWLNNTDIPGEDSDEFRAMTNLLTRAQVSVYPIDPRGVEVDPGLQAGYSANHPGAADLASASQTSFLQRSSEHAAMQTIASDTGGEPYYNRNDLTKGVADAIESGSNYYTLSYSPSEQKTGGEWRSIRIEFANPEAHKGVHLSYRRGYFANNIKVPAHHTGTAEVNEDPNAATVQANRYARLAMLHGAPTQQDIPFTTRVLPASTSTEDTVAADNGLAPTDPMKPPYRRYDVDCAAAARYFSLTERPDGHHVGSVQVAVIVYDVQGKPLNTASRTLQFDLTPQAYADFQRLGFREHLEISAPAKGESFFRIGIEERISGRIGTVEVASSAVSNLPPPEYAQAPSQQRKKLSPPPDSSSRP